MWKAHLLTPIGCRRARGGQDQLIEGGEGSRPSVMLTTGVFTEPPWTGALRATSRSPLIFFLARSSLDAIESDLSTVPRARPFYAQGLDDAANTLSGGDLLTEQWSPEHMMVSFGLIGLQVAVV